MPAGIVTDGRSRALDVRQRAPNAKDYGAPVCKHARSRNRGQEFSTMLDNS